MALATVSSKYTSTLSGKAGLVEETFAVLRQVAHGVDKEALRTAVIEQDLLGKDTHHSRTAVWDKLNARYLADWQRAAHLAQLIAWIGDRAAAGLLLYYEFCLSDTLLFDAVTCLAYPRYAAGFSGLEISDLQAWLDEQEPEHPEICDWSPQTRKKALSNVLAVLRDFGLMSGVNRKTFQNVYLPTPVAGYVLYRLHQARPSLGPRGVLEAAEWRLFWQAEEDVLAVLGELDAAGYCTFKRQGEMMMLSLTWPDLEACIANITGKV